MPTVIRSPGLKPIEAQNASSSAWVRYLATRAAASRWYSSWACLSVAGCPNSQKYSVVRSFLKHLFTHQPRTHRSWQTPHKSNSEQVVLKLLCISAEPPSCMRMQRPVAIPKPARPLTRGRQRESRRSIHAVTSRRGIENAWHLHARMALKRSSCYLVPRTARTKTKSLSILRRIRKCVISTPCCASAISTPR
jgi:hypothetical protein